MNSVTASKQAASGQAATGSAAALATGPADFVAPAVDGRAARWQGHREERRRELIKAARKAVHTLGSDASMEDIAAAAGTSKPVFYRYFGDKAGLQQAMGEVVLAQMQRKMKEAVATATSAREGLFAMVSAYLQMAGASPNVYAFVTRLPHGEAGQQDAIAASGALGHFFESISAMMAAPMREHLGPDAEVLIGYWPTAAIGMVRSAGELWLSSPDSPGKPDEQAMAEHLTDWLCAGIAPGSRTTQNQQ
ncbi:TetR family transcriptional regulator [Arthrobacter sp. R-11]|uniref:TetR family transcriptional regulator n=1 Tax=Arthrobacter sp. R-11 TaxID=3404053 RepID=UPI003CF43801